MVRRTVLFVAAVALVGGVASLVYFNSQPTTLRWGPRQEITLPLAWLLVGSTVAGASIGFLMLLAREGRWALRHWRVTRKLRATERAAARRSEARQAVLAGRYASARALLEKTASGPGAVVDDAVDYAEAFLAEGRAADARAFLEDARRDLGEDPRILYSLARACRAVGDEATAVAVLDRAVDLLPASFALHALLRDCLVALGWWQRADAVEQRIVDLHPADRTEKKRLIDIRMRTAEDAAPAEREAALRSVLAMDPGLASAASAHAAMLRGQGYSRSAVRVLWKAAKTRPERETLAALEETLEKANPRRLLRLYRALGRRHPRSREVAAHHAALLVRLGRSAEAAPLLARFPDLQEPVT